MTSNMLLRVLLILLLLHLPLYGAAAVDSVPSATSSAVSTQTAPPDMVQAMEAHYRDLADLTAKVTQKNYLKSVDKTQTFEGTLSIKKPGKLRLEYTNGQVIVVDGKEAWFYSKKSEQAIRRTFKDFEQANIPVAFLLGAAHMRDDFEVLAPVETASGRTVVLRPKKGGAAMQRIELVGDDQGRIIAMTLIDRSGNSSAIAFSKVQENSGIDDAPFRFKVPKGTEIIEQ